MRKKPSPHSKTALVRACTPTRYVSEPLEMRLHFALGAQLEISEFMAKNNSTIKDDTGLYSDWIELHNTGDTAAELGGWKLTDSASDLSEWQFPAGVSLPSGGYLVVWASGLDHKTPGLPLHTNFKLNDTGEYLALVQPDGVVHQAFAPTYPDQDSDISYGLSDDTNMASTPVYFYKPTPGAVNQPNAAPVTFSKPGGGYTATFNLTLASATPGVTIRYTTNGSVPTPTSGIYSVPISVNRDMIVRAQAFATGLLTSPISSAQYFLLDSSVSTFQSNLPVVVIDTGGASVGEETQTPATAMVLAPPSAGGNTTLTQAPEFVGRAGLNIRGQSSAGFPKHQYHFELWDESDGDDGHSLLGMPKEADWVLYAPYSEKSLMQNQLAYKWANEMGEYAVRTRWVEVFINGSGQDSLNYNNDYQGVYLLMEKIEVGPDRVNIAPLVPGQDSLPEISGGYLWHKDKSDPEDTTGFSGGYQQYLFEDPKPEELDATQKAWISNYVGQFENALYVQHNYDPVNGYAKYINVQSFIDNWIDVELSKNIDGYRISTYFYKDRNGKITMGPVWDYNLAMGNANYNAGDTPIGWYHDVISPYDYGYFSEMQKDPAFMRALATRWKELRGSVLSTGKMMADIDANFATLTNGNGNYPVGTSPTQTSNNPVVRNFKKWQVLGTYIWPNAVWSSSWLDEVNRLRDFMSTRASWMDSQLFPLIPTVAPGAPTALIATPLSGGAVQLNWNLADANAASIYIDRSENGGAWTQVGILAGTDTVYTATGLKAGTNYAFQVRAWNSYSPPPLPPQKPGAASNSATAKTTSDIPTIDIANFTGASGIHYSAGSKLVVDSGTGLGTAQVASPDLNKAGGVWSTSQQDIRKFTTTFSFQLKSPSAEGMTFTIQRTSNSAFGAAGSGLGYQNIVNSLAIKFDMGPNGSTTGLYTGGAAPVGGPTETTPGTIDFRAGHVITCTLSYDGKDLTQLMVDTATGATFTKTFTGIDIPTIVGGANAYVGFTAATSLTTVDARVTSWQFTSIASEPTVLNSIIIGDGNGQRSQVKRINLWFSRGVTLAPGAVRLEMLNTGGSGTDDGSAPTDITSVLGTPATLDGGKTWIIPFVSNSPFIQTSGGVSTGSLMDGIYRAIVDITKVSASGGMADSPATTTTFHRLFGDLNGDAAVNALDYAKFRSAFGSSSGDAAFLDAFDFDNNFAVNAVDYAQFRLRFGKSLLL
jgi:hypothetical protein